MRTHRTMVMVVVVIVAAACSSRVARESGGDVDLGSRTIVGEDWGGELRGIGGWANLRGSAYARETESGTMVSLTLERGVAGAAYAWEVLEGTCGSQGRPVAEVLTLPGIFLDDAGRGSAVGSLPTKLVRGRPYYINVYTSSDKRDAPIACGPITN